ncbi:MAG: 50S ribosomal protein L4 [Candidatus Muirbacterium halophilum]|nr:50S ribosomal protein L4 [Candidatus Muirbacterium halophilum]
MAKISVLNMNGKEIEKMDISDSIFGVEINKNLIHESIIQQLANKRVGTSSTKSRSEVTGSGIKPFRQKGTGRARQGTNKSPLMPGGGIAFGPKPRDYSKRMNKTAKKIAVKSALTDKLVGGKTWAVDLKIDEIKTKIFETFFNGADVYGKYNLFVYSNNDNRENLIKSVRNIEKVKAINIDSINVYDLVRYENIFFSKHALNKIEEVYNAN